jgi:hypothetical protein
MLLNPTFFNAAEIREGFLPAANAHMFFPLPTHICAPQNSVGNDSQDMTPLALCVVNFGLQVGGSTRFGVSGPLQKGRRPAAQRVFLRSSR